MIFTSFYNLLIKWSLFSKGCFGKIYTCEYGNFKRIFMHGKMGILNYFQKNMKLGGKCSPHSGFLFLNSSKSNFFQKKYLRTLQFSKRKKKSKNMNLDVSGRHLKSNSARQLETNFLKTPKFCSKIPYGRSDTFVFFFHKIQNPYKEFNFPE